MKKLQIWKCFNKKKLYDIFVLKKHWKRLNSFGTRQWKQLELRLLCFSVMVCYYLAFPFNVILTLNWLSRIRYNTIVWRNRQRISTPNQPFQLIFWGWLTAKVSIPSTGLLLIYESVITLTVYVPVTLITVSLGLLRLGFLNKYFYDPVEEVSIFVDNMLWKTFRHIYWDFNSDAQQDKTIFEKGLESWEFISNFWGQRADKLKWAILWQVDPDFCCFLQSKFQKRNFEQMYYTYSDHRARFWRHQLVELNVLDKKHFNEYNYQVLITQKELLDGTFFAKGGTEEWRWAPRAGYMFHPGSCYPYNPGFGYFPQQKNYAWVTQYLILIEFQMLNVLGEANFLKLTDRNLLDNFERYDYLKTIYNSVKKGQSFQERENVLHTFLSNEVNFLNFNDALNLRSSLMSFRGTLSGWRDIQYYEILRNHGPLVRQIDNISSKSKWNIIFHLDFEDLPQTNLTNRVIEFKEKNS